MQENPKFARFQRFLGVFLVAVAAFFAGHYFGKSGYIYEIRKNPPKIEIINKTPSVQKIDFDLFWDVWDLTAAQYLLRPVDAKKMLYGAIEGAVRSLGDPYTSFLTPDQNKVVADALNGTYEGIGAELGMKEGQLMVVAPLDGSPAKEFGLLAGDRITQIDGQTTVGITLAEAVAKIRGTAGTVVELMVKREEAKEPFALKIKRGEITIDSVTWADKGDGVAYIRVSRFGVDTNETWSGVVGEVSAKMPQINAIVVDLRGNPGGYMKSAIYIASEFFTGKPVMYEETATGEQVVFNADREGSFKRIPVFVLIDGGSASASEILAAGLKENTGAVLIGEKSFGKGTIQDAREFTDGSGLHITVAKWLTPKKEWVHNVGIAPDVVVERKSEDITAGVDKQLEKALELARK